MKKGLRHTDVIEVVSVCGNGPRPYEEGIKTSQASRLAGPIGTDPDLMKKGLRRSS